MEVQTPTIVNTAAHDYWLDNIKGILMIAVVVGHMTAQISARSDVINSLYILINTFHMATYLILSGYMSKRKIDQKDYISVINGYIIPYITAQAVVYLSAALLPEGLRAANSTYFNQSTFSFLVPVYQLWYLMAITLHVLICIKLQPKRHPVLFMVGAIGASLACGYFLQINILRFSKAIAFFPFFLLGYLLPKDFMMKIRNKWQIIVVAVVIWIGYVIFMINSELTTGLNKIFGLATRYANIKELFLGLPPVLGRLVFLLAVPVVSLAFYALCPRRKTIFSKLGQNSRYIFVLHAPVVFVFRCLQYEYNYLDYIDNTWYLKLAFLLLAVGLTFVLGSNWVKKLAKPVLEPNFDIVNVVGSLNERYQKKKADK